MSARLKKILSLRIRLNLPWALVCLLLASVAATGLMFYLQPDFGVFLPFFKEHGLKPFLLNGFLIASAMFFVYFLTGRAAFSAGFVTFVMSVLSLINRNKIYLRHDPFVPWDVFLGGEVMAVSQSFNPGLIIKAFVFLAALLIFIIIICVFVRDRKLPFMARLVGMAAVAGIFVFMKTAVYRNGKIYNGLDILGNRYNQTNNFNSKGFLYAFLYTLNTSKIVKPEGYDAAAVAKRQNMDTQGETDALLQKDKWQVVIVLGEAFSELPMAPQLSYDGYADPLANYKRIKEDALHGYICAPGLGGGTADTEFDVLTGLSARHFRGVPYAYNLVAKRMGSLAWAMGNIGYDPVAIHPGYAWFYNRSNVYPLFGFRQFIDMSAFNLNDNIAGYMSEKDTIDRVLKEYNDNLPNGPKKPILDFCVTIQNHGPYEDKYGAPQNFNSSVPLSTAGANALANYIYGLKDADRELGRLCDTLNQSDRPTVLLYYGDHLPMLPDDVYDALIAPDDRYDGQVRLYRTPFLIWENAAAKAEDDFTQRESGLELPPDKTVTSNYLGAMLLELMGYDSIDPFYAFINQLRRAYPILLENEYGTPDGAIHDMTDEPRQDIQTYLEWEYYRVTEPMNGN